MTATLAVALAAVLATTASGGDAPAPPGDAAAPADGATVPSVTTALLAEASLSATPAEGGALAMGGRLTLRLGPFAVAGSVELAETPARQPALGALLLLGPGVVHDVSPRLGAHGTLLVGLELVNVRDYVHGGEREVVEPAVGARAGVEWRLRGRAGRRFHSGWLGQLGVAPVLGVSAAVLYAATGRDRLRGVEWGGLANVVSFTLGAEIASPPRAVSLPAER